MSTFTLDEAKAQLSRLVSMVESNEKITITKRGRAVVKLAPSDPPRQKMPQPCGTPRQMTPQTESAGEFIRKLRESDRY